MSPTNQQRNSKERFWRRMARQWRSSGLSIRDFCAEYDLAEATFYAWRRIIAQRDADAADFVPVHVLAEPTPTAEASGTGLELLLGASRVLRIAPGFDGPTLKRLLALLEEGRP
jgi:transposase-like protein